MGHWSLSFSSVFSLTLPNCSVGESRLKRSSFSVAEEEPLDAYLESRKKEERWKEKKKQIHFFFFWRIRFVISVQKSTRLLSRDLIPYVDVLRSEPGSQSDLIDLNNSQ